MSTAVGRHSHGYFRQAEPVGPVKTRSGLLRRLLPWGPTVQPPASSLLAGPVAVAEEAENQQRGGEPQLTAMDERLADTGEQKAVTEAGPEFADTSDVGQLEPWGPFPPASQPVTAAEADPEAPTPSDMTVADPGFALTANGAPRPVFSLEVIETQPEPPVWLRALDPSGKPLGDEEDSDLQLFGAPRYAGLADLKTGGYLAEVNLGECPEGSYVIAAERAYHRAAAAAHLAAADALDRQYALDAERAAEQGTEPVTGDETTPVADDAVQTEVTDGDLAAVSGQEGETQS